MAKRTTALSAAAIALSVALMPGAARAEAAGSADPAEMSPEAMMKIMAEAAQPGAEHEKLRPLVGKWKYTCKMWMAPGQPPIDGTGTIERKMILGGRFLEERIVGTGPDGKTEFEGRGVVGYDKAQGKYTYGWICTMGTGITASVGECSSDGKHFTFQTDMFCPVRGKKVKGRDEIQILSGDKHTLTSYMFEDGQEMKMMELTASRVK